MCLIGEGGEKMLNMNQYNEQKADSLDKLIYAALKMAAERLFISNERKRELLNRIKNNTQK